MNQNRKAFTLIELLTVMAISAVLLGLIVIPLVQSFNLTRAGQAFGDAQDKARVVTDRIAHDIGIAALVSGGTALVTTTVNGVAAKLPQGSEIIRLPNKARTGTVDVVLPSTKMDLWMPAEGDQSQNVGGVYTDPVTGFIDPTLASSKGQVVLPVAPGATMIRYFVYRRDPFTEYNNPYDGILMAQAGGRDNLYVLGRAEVTPYVLRAGVGTNGDTSVAWRPNLQFFLSDAATDRILMDDPRFMEPTRDNTGKIVDDRATANSQGFRLQNWLSKTINQTEVSRYDMVTPVYDLRTHVAQFDANGVPRVLPLIQFRPERINNDPATAQVAVRQGQESDSAGSYAADVFQTQYPLWSNPIVRLYPAGWLPTDTSANEYLISASGANAGSPGFPLGNALYMFDPDVQASDVDVDTLPELFDQSLYTLLASQKNVGATIPDQIYPFSSAVLASNSRSSWLTSAKARQLFTPFAFNSDRGKIQASFPIWEVGNPASAPSDPSNNPLNLPSAPTSAVTGQHPTPPYTPETDPFLTGNFYDAEFASINEKFNKIGNDFSALLPNQVQRFMDLRYQPQSDGTPSPLNPNAINGQATGFTYNTPDGGYRSKVQIVPGSEVVMGPDQLLLSGNQVRYTRVSVGEPGPNQYKINYSDVQEPLNAAGQIDYSVAYPGMPLGGFNPRVYDPQNVVSAILQPRYKVGYIQFNSDPANALPFVAGSPQGSNIYVSYRFQFTGRRTGIAAKPVSPGLAGGSTTDSFAVDYDTRQLMSVLLTVRNYAQSSLPNPQSVTLKSTAAVRNFIR